MSTLRDDVKKVALASIGAAALTAEKAHEVTKELVKKGEEVVAEGKQANEELKHKIKNKVNPCDAKDDVAAEADYTEVDQEAPEE